MEVTPGVGVWLRSGDRLGVTVWMVDCVSEGGGDRAGVQDPADRMIPMAVKNIRVLIAKAI